MSKFTGFYGVQRSKKTVQQFVKERSATQPQVFFISFAPTENKPWSIYTKNFEQILSQAGIIDFMIEILESISPLRLRTKGMNQHYSNRCMKTRAVNSAETVLCRS